MCFCYLITTIKISFFIFGIESSKHNWQIVGNETHHLKSWCNFVVMIDPVCILVLCTLRVNFDGAGESWEEVTVVRMEWQEGFRLIGHNT